MTFFSRVAFSAATFFWRWASTNAPFLIERVIAYAFDFRRRMMNPSVRLLLRVFMPLVCQPQGEVG